MEKISYLLVIRALLIKDKLMIKIEKLYAQPDDSLPDTVNRLYNVSVGPQ